MERRETDFSFGALLYRLERREMGGERGGQEADLLGRREVGGGSRKKRGG